MTVVPLPVPHRRQRTALQRPARAAIAPWEWTCLVLVLFLSMTAVVPLIFNPSSGTGRDVDVYDPVSQAAWLLILLLLTIGAVRARSDMLPALLRNPAILAFCYLAFASILWSDAPPTTIKTAIELAFSTVLGAYFGVRFGVERVVRALSWVCVAIVALSVLFVFGLPEYGIDAIRENDWRGVFTTKNELGRVCVLGAVTWAVRGFADDVPRLRASLVVAVIAIVGYESGARTALGVGMLMIGVGLLAWLLGHRDRAWAPVKGVVVCAIAFIAIASTVNLKLLLAVVGSDFQLTGRLGIWEAVWSAILDRPLAGYGYNAFWRGLDGPSLAVFRQAQLVVPHSHNGFLDLLLALGVVGLVTYLAALATVFWRAVGELHTGSGTERTFPFVFLCFIVLYNITETGFTYGRSFQWIIFVTIATALAQSRHEVAPRESSRSRYSPARRA